MEREEVLQGRKLRAEDVEWLKGWIEANPGWSRKRIARELCRQWEWRDGKGRLKDFAARSLLLKLAGQGRIHLPALQTHKRRAPRRVSEPVHWEEPEVLACSLARLGKIELAPVAAGSAAAGRWAFYLTRYHYLGLRVVGENVGYLARDEGGRDLACLLFGAAAWRCASRDQTLGWTEEERREQLGRVAGNTRFLILPWVRVPHLASHLLGRVVRRIGADWRERYGHDLDWLESFVERDRFRGTCYRAANWRWVGATQGRSRQDRERRLQVPVKDVYLYRLHRGKGGS